MLHLYSVHCITIITADSLLSKTKLGQAPLHEHEGGTNQSETSDLQQVWAD